MYKALHKGLSDGEVTYGEVDCFAFHPKFVMHSFTPCEPFLLNLVKIAWQHVVWSKLLARKMNTLIQGSIAAQLCEVILCD